MGYAMMPVFNHKKLHLYMLRRPYQHHVHKIIKILKKYQQNKQNTFNLFYPPNLTIKKKAYLSRYPTGLPRTHHRIAGCFQAPLGTRAPSFSYLPGLFKKSTNSTTSAWWFRLFFVLKQKKHSMVDFFFVGGMGCGNFDETCGGDI